MAPLPEEVPGEPVQGESEFSVVKQRVDLDVNFAGRSLKGSTEITIQPLKKELKTIALHCRQCRPTAIQVGGISAKWEYRDPYQRLRLPENSSVHQHEILKERFTKSLRPGPELELIISLPPKLKIQELSAEPRTQSINIPSAQSQSGGRLTIADGPIMQLQNAEFVPIQLFIEFEVSSFRDGLHWLGYAEGDRRYPHVYTKAGPWPGNTSSIFPCVDDTTSRNLWEISIRCPRTLGDAFRSPPASDPARNASQDLGDSDIDMSGEVDAKSTALNGHAAKTYLIDLADDETSLELVVVCSGEMVDDVVDSEDEGQHTVSFKTADPLTARHIGFAIGPFEYVDLYGDRESDVEQRSGQHNIKIGGYCLPGKSQELHNTCYPIPRALDNLSQKYGHFPFKTFQVLFVDDLVHETFTTAGLSFCSSSLLFPRSVIEPIYSNTRTLIRTLAEQWSGVNVIARDPDHEWIVAGMAGFMTDAYMKDLCGNNEFRWQQKLESEKVYDLDVDRPALIQLGPLLHLDHTLRDFVNTKSALVLHILDRRLLKVSGSTGVQRVINRIFSNTPTALGGNGTVSTMDFQRWCERCGHNKLESFFRQWVFNSGCPIFSVSQRFNKKKLVVEMTIAQRQLERSTKPPFEPSNFMREIKEHVGNVWAPETNPVFTGSMTIRIHEADGTPYEHIVEIKEAVTKLEIPYNTKYKRLKRSRRQKERQMAEGVTVEGGEDSLLFSMGDKFQTEEEKADWNLMDWTQDDEEKMGQESYEWIRMDADFEWIGKIHLVMPLYMYVSQLQQDRDIVAQYDSMRYLLASNPHHVSLSILVRTLMDEKYFWGIREMAAEGLATCAKDKWAEIGQYHLTKAFKELFCIPGTNMPKSNDFSDRRTFIIQCALARAMAQLRDEDGKVPMQIRQFFVDLLKFNDNSNNMIDDGDSDTSTYSDCHYIATLMRCLSDSLIASHREVQPTYTFSFGDEEPMEAEDTLDLEFEKLAIAQIERHRRIDEWDPSYQNLYSITALNCLQQLTKAGIVKDKTTELMQYVRAGNADNVRLAAWRCLSEIGVARKPSVMRYLLHCLTEDPSPRFRDGLMTVFEETLGRVALGDPGIKTAPPLPSADTGLILEQEPNTEARRLEAARKTTPDGALLALQTAVVDANAFKTALWSAASSTNPSLDEIGAICDIAALIYEPVDSLVLKLKLPSMWRCENLGQGKVKLIPHPPYRTTPQKPLAMSDWQKLEANGLKYEGPLAAEIVQKQKDAQNVPTPITLELKTAQIQQPMQQAQSGGESTDMAPPSATTTPANEKTGFRLSLGAKRKQSVDISAQRANSPKAPKLTVDQAPASASQSPRARNSPAASKRRSSTPASKSSVSKPKRAKNVILRFPGKASQAQDILSASSQLQGSASPATAQQFAPVTPTLPQSPAFPSTLLQSPSNGINVFEARAPFGTAPHPGLFRSYEPAPDTDAPEPEVKLESVEMAESPVETNGEVTQALVDEQPEAPAVVSSPTVETKKEMPPPPRPKLTLKLGSSRKSSTQGFPE